MPIAVCWDNDEHTIIRWDFEGKWTWQQAYEALEVESSLLDTIDQAVRGVIVNMQNSATVPGGAPAHFTRLSRRNAKSGGTMIVGLSVMGEIILAMYNNFQRDPTKRIHVAESLEAARATLEKRCAPDNPAAREESNG